jgi:hypothetical protein
MAKVTVQGDKAGKAAAVTPSDTEDIMPTNGIYVGAAGDLQVTLKGMPDGESIVFKGLVAGMIHPIKAKRIWAASTTATNILAVY